MSSSRPRRRRVLVVEDSAFMRALLREHITLAGFEVVGEATTGYQAIRLVHELEPDVVTMDLEMPELGGLDAIGYIMSESPRPVVIVSAHTEALVDPALAAMLSGAIDFVAKPAGPGHDSEKFRRQLRHALHAAAVARLFQLPERGGPGRAAWPFARPHGAGEAALNGDVPVDSPAPAPPCAVVIGASTGGPRALAEVVPALPHALAAAVFIVQHMPPLFTKALARRLDGAGELAVREAEHGEIVRSGCAYLAPGGQHLELERAAGAVRIRLSHGPPVWGVRPSADVLFAAAARTFGPATVGAVLTGMGRDGAKGLHAVREVGGFTLAQDEATSVIASMPRAAAAYAECVLPLQEIAGELVRRVAAKTARPSS